MNQAIKIINHFNKPVYMYIILACFFLFICYSFGQDGTFALDSKLNDSGSIAYKWVRRVINIVCVFFVLAGLWSALVSGNKGAWWMVVGVIVFALIANNAVEIYNTLIPGADVKIK